MKKVDFYDASEFNSMTDDAKKALELSYVEIKANKIKTGSQFSAAEYKSIEWLDTAKTIPFPGRVIFGGKPNNGKTWVTDNSAIDIALRGRRVMRIVGEGSMAKERDRFIELLHGAFGNETQLAELDNLVFVQYPPDLFSARGVWLLEKMIVDYKPEVIFLDPLVSVFTGDENSTVEARFFCQTLEELIQEYNITIVLIHHTNKMGIELRGSTTLQGWADAIYSVSQSITNGQKTFTVTNTKMRDDDLRPNRFYNLIKVYNEEFETDMPCLKAVEEKDAIGTQEDRAAAFALEQTKPWSRYALKTAIKVSDTAATALVEKLLADGVIDHAVINKVKKDGSVTHWPGYIKKAAQS